MQKKSADLAGADSFLKSLHGIQDSKQRMTKLMEFINELEPKQIAEILHHIQEATAGQADLLRLLQMDLIRHREFIENLPYETLTSIYQYASDRDWTTLTAFLRSNPAFQAEGETLPEGYAKKLSSLTLGERKQLSRGQIRKNIEFLLFDSNPMVIRELLKNPRLVEKDVIRMASRFKAPNEVLEEICKSKKWIDRYHVKKALVFNPQTPLSYALGLIPHLKKEDLRLVTQGKAVRSEILKAAKQRM